MKRCIALLAVLLFLLCGCAQTEDAAGTDTTGTAPVSTTETRRTQLEQRQETRIRILLPDERSLSWQQAGEDLQNQLTLMFYQAELLYAGGSATKQAQQIETAVSEGVDALVLAPVESAALTDACALALDAGIPIISYDRLLMDTEAVSCYISFDYQAMGRAIGTHIVASENLDALAEEEFRTIEFFMGSPEDNNALLLYLGIMEVLEPYLHSGTLVSLSGRTAFEDTCVVDWDKTAVTRGLASYRKEYYEGGIPDILCTVSDEFADACITQIGNIPPETYPLITGIGGSTTAREQLENGTLAMTISTDLLQLNDRLVKTVADLLAGKEPEFNNTESCHNNAITVPAYLCEFELLT